MKIHGLKGLLRDALCHTAASVTRLIFLFLFFFPVLPLKLFYLFYFGERVQGQRVETKGWGNEWDGDA